MIRFLAVAIVLAACATPPGEEVARAQLPDLPPLRSFTTAEVTPPQRSNREIASNFMDLAFRLESGRTLDVFTRFEGPLTIRVSGAVPPTVSADLGRLLARLRSEAGLNIATVTGDDAAITIEFLPRQTMQRFVPKAACFVAPRVGSWEEYRRVRRDALDWSTLQTRTRATIFIPNDMPPQEIRDCLHEELAQALGPLNDLYELPDSVFNDDNIHTVLTGFDMLILRAYYAPELQSGLTAQAVASYLPGILARLNPRGEGIGGAVAEPTPRAYVEAIETALGPGSAGPRRRAAIRRAIDIAEARGWNDTRTGFAWLALGRLSLGSDPEDAVAAFARAAQIYHADPRLSLQSAHADMQLAAYALTAGQAEDALQLTSRALPHAAAAENAALLSTLLMIRAEALDLVGRASEARQVRLDSLGWARYGFGSDAEVRARLKGIAALSPAQRQGRT
ncbi:MAG: DUF2927 domain-containing protein [Paracoccaceae bacterium]